MARRASSRVRLVDGSLSELERCVGCDVRDLTFCACLDAAGFRDLHAVMSRTRAAAGAVLAEEGAQLTDVFNLTTGMAMTYKALPDGRRQVTGFLLPGDFLGLAGTEVYADSAEAVTDVQLCRYPASAFSGFLATHPKAEHHLLAVARGLLAAAQDHRLLLGRKSASARLAWFLLTMAERYRGRVAVGDVVLLPMSRHDIADYLGLTVETVSRAFTRLRKAGLIAMTVASAPVLAAPERLAVLAENDEA
jgi:CRP/FNR family transcriptional regulator, anaerobic regulatory protein